MVLVGCTPPGRRVEQHDFFFGIANSIEDLFPEIKAFWPEGKVHIDAWREVNKVEDYQIKITSKGDKMVNPGQLFFINLGGYLENRFEEQHYIILTVKRDKAEATKEAKSTLFYEHNNFEGAPSHIDDRYGIDVDDIYQIEDLLSPTQKQQYQVEIIPAVDLGEDAFHLGYLKLPMVD